MPRYVFSNGKITVEEGLYTPLKREGRRSGSGVLILAKTMVKPGKQVESTQEEQSDVHP